MFGKATGVVRASLGAMSTARDVATLVEFLRQTYTDQTVHSTIPKLDVLVPTMRTFSLSAPQSPGAVSAHSLVVPKSAGSGNMTDIAETALPDLDAKPKPPIWNPQDYVDMRKAWRDDTRKQFANYPVDIKLKEIEDASMYSRANQTPSVKARKFGRSVVNLLRTKSHVTETNSRYEQTVK